MYKYIYIYKSKQYAKKSELAHIILSHKFWALNQKEETEKYKWISLSKP